jgi:NADH-quinone oxidoreductase subunit G
MAICELQSLAEEYFIRDNPFELKTRGLAKDFSTPSIFRDPDKCVMCRRCIDACSVTQSVNALGIQDRGNKAIVVPTMGGSLIDSPCVMCGQCVHACPVGAIGEVEDIDRLLAAINDPDKIVVTQIAPAVRVAVSEEVGMAPGELPMDVLVAGLRQLGFDYVLHTNFTADLTIIEEGNELLKSAKRGRNFAHVYLLQPGMDKLL